MRGQAVALTVVVLTGFPARAGAQSEESRTAVQFIATAHEVYSVREPEPEPCSTPVGNEIVVCAERDEPDDQRLPSPTERAYVADEMPHDPIPSAPYVFGLHPCNEWPFCRSVGKAPPPIYIIDLSKIPEPLTPEEAALVFRAEDLPSPEEASPAAAP